METRKPQLTEMLPFMFTAENVKRILTGAGANTIASLLLLPITYAWNRKQLAHQSYRETVQILMTREGIKTVFNATKEMAMLAPLQSLTYLGLGNAILKQYDNRPIYQRAFIAGGASGFLESVTNFKLIHAIVAKYSLNTEHNPPLKFFSVRSARCFQATWMRNGIANPLTLGGVLYLEDALHHSFHPGTNTKPSAVTSAIAGGLMCFIVSYLVNPLVLLQTYTLNNPDLPVLYHARRIRAQPLTAAWTGCLGRATGKGLQGLLTFGLLNIGNRLLGTHTPSVEIAAASPSTRPN